MSRVRNMAMALTALLILLAPVARATPIKPDLKTLLAAPQAQAPFVPARAGWNGPEARTEPASSALQYLMRRPPLWEEIAALAIPDPRLIVLLTLSILLLRILRQRADKEKEFRKAAEVVPFPPGQEQKAA